MTAEDAALPPDREDRVWIVRNPFVRPANGDPGRWDKAGLFLLGSEFVYQPRNATNGQLELKILLPLMRTATQLVGFKEYSPYCRNSCRQLFPTTHLNSDGLRTGRGSFLDRLGSARIQGLRQQRTGRSHIDATPTFETLDWSGRRGG